MFLASFAVLIGLQAATVMPSQQPESNLIQETWTLEYDIAILPFIEDYKRCLNYGNRVARGIPDFEEQHLSDLPRCGKVARESIKASAAALDRRGLSDQYPPEQVAETFYRLGQIHIERGRFIDDSFHQRMAVLEQYERTQTQRNERLNVENP